MADPVRQSASANGDGASTTIAVAFAQAVLPGSTIVVYTTNDTSVAGTASVSDDVNGAYPAALKTLNDAGNNARTEAFAFSNTAAGTPTVTVTWTGAGVAARGIIIHEVPDVLVASVDQSAAQNQTTPGTFPDLVTSTPTGRLTKLRSVVLGVCSNSSGTNTPGVGAGFTDLGATWNFFAGPNIGRSEVKVVNGLGGVAATFTAGANNAHQTIVVVLMANPDLPYVPPQTPIERLDTGDGDFPAELTLLRWF